MLRINGHMPCLMTCSHWRSTISGKAAKDFFGSRPSSSQPKNWESIYYLRSQISGIVLSTCFGYHAFMLVHVPREGIVAHSDGFFAMLALEDNSKRPSTLLKAVLLFHQVPLAPGVGSCLSVMVIEAPMEGACEQEINASRVSHRVMDACGIEG